jgi:hypothetical protein
LIEGRIDSGLTMLMSEVTAWAVLAALVALPLCYYFWKRWDRPSRAAKREQDRRLKEREVRQIFLKEEAKMREAERGQALVSIEERKKSDAMPPSTETLTMAISSLDGEPIPGANSGSSSTAQGGSGIPGISSELVAEARSAAEIAELESIPDSIEVPDIEPDESVPDILEDTGPIALKVSIELPDEITRPTSEIPAAKDGGPEESNTQSQTGKFEPSAYCDEDIDWPEWE